MFIPPPCAADNSCFVSERKPRIIQPCPSAVRKPWKTYRPPLPRGDDSGVRRRKKESPLLRTERKGPHGTGGAFASRAFQHDARPFGQAFTVWGRQTRAPGPAPYGPYRTWAEKKTGTPLGKDVARPAYSIGGYADHGKRGKLPPGTGGADGGTGYAVSLHSFENTYECLCGSEASAFGDAERRSGGRARPGPRRTVPSVAPNPAGKRRGFPRGGPPDGVSGVRARQKSRPCGAAPEKRRKRRIRLPANGPPAPEADPDGPCRWGRTGRKCRAP